MSQRIVVLCLGKSALTIAQKIRKHLNAQLHLRAERNSSCSSILTENNQSKKGLLRDELENKEVDVFFTNVKEHLTALFSEGTAIIGVCASGILIRGVARCLEKKQNEPPLIAVAEDGSSVVPLLGGHHGANALSRNIGELIGISPAITTAGDLRFGIALDEPPQGFVLANPDAVKAFTAELLAGESVMNIQENKALTQSLVKGKEAVVPDNMEGFYKWLQESRLPFTENGKFRISLSLGQISGNAEHLVYHPISEIPANDVVVGIGCERGTESKELIKLVLKALDKNDISPERVALVVSLDLKSDEPAIHELAAFFTEKSGSECPVRFFDAATLEAQAPDLQNPSEIVFREVGCHGVAEGAALAAVAASGSSTSSRKLLVPKIKSSKSTCAVAELEDLIAPEKIGRPRGTLFVVGIGPGDPEWRIPETQKMLQKATDWVGYGLYLDLISDLHIGQKLHHFDLGEEKRRVQHSLELAAQGKTVALVSSGDPGIYAMSSLVFEMLGSGISASPSKNYSKEDSVDGWQRIHVEVSPGISALQAASARIGAPLGHDFCTISLSDLLTSWETIERRIHSAAEGDFVIAFYNPVSRRRSTQLLHAKKILLKHRLLETPVIIARNLGRKEEKIKVVSLEKLDPAEVDMMTVVLVGSSQSCIVELPNGVVKVYTPRGYDKKKEN